MPTLHPTGPTSSTAPVFVVGTPRSGTTLLAAMLGAHPLIDCGPETRFFAWLERADRAALLDPAHWPGPAADFVTSLVLGDSPVHELYGVGPDGIRAALAARPPSVAALLESLTVTRAAAHGKPRWAEKTPRHLESLPLIRREWPDAAIVRVVRDPRDVALSLTGVHFGSGSVVVNLATAAAQERRFAPFLARDRRSLTVRFEDLVREPDATMRRVCSFIDVPFDQAMIDRREGSEGVAAPHETWKHKAGQPLDPSRVDAWRATMEPATQRFAALHCRDLLRAHGYEGARDPRRSVALVPLGAQVAVKHEGLLLALAMGDAVVAEPVPVTPRDLAHHDALVFWGQPGQLGLRLGTGALARTRELALLAALLGRRRVAGRGPIWVRRRTSWPARATDPTERAVAHLLRGLARTCTPAELPAVLGLPQRAVDRPDE